MTETKLQRLINCQCLKPFKHFDPRTLTELWDAWNLSACSTKTWNLLSHFSRITGSNALLTLLSHWSSSVINTTSPRLTMGACASFIFLLAAVKQGSDLLKMVEAAYMYSPCKFWMPQAATATDLSHHGPNFSLHLHSIRLHLYCYTENYFSNTLQSSCR